MRSPPASTSSTLAHVGIAIAKDSPLPELLRLLGLTSTQTAVPRESLVAHMVSVAAPHARLELLDTDNPSSTVGRFLKTHGPGIHHLCLTVPAFQLERISERLRQHGYRLLLDRAELGAEGTLVNFVHPKSTGGVLLELQEQPGDGEP